MTNVILSTTAADRSAKSFTHSYLIPTAKDFSLRCFWFQIPACLDMSCPSKSLYKNFLKVKKKATKVDSLLTKNTTTDLDLAWPLSLIWWNGQFLGAKWEQHILLKAILEPKLLLLMCCYRLKIKDDYTYYSYLVFIIRAKWFKIIEKAAWMKSTGQVH